MNNKLSTLFGENKDKSSADKLRSKINSAFGDKKQSNNETMFDKLNPFTDSSGNVKNKNIDYGKVAENSGSTQTKRWASAAAQKLSPQNKNANYIRSNKQSKSASDNAAGAAIVKEAEKYLGTPYVWGGESTGGFDCSGLVQYVCAQNGISVPRTTYEQINAGTAVDKSSLTEGDLVFFGDASSPHHVGIYIGGGRYLHAPKTGDVVKISNLGDRSDFAGARRITK